MKDRIESMLTKLSNHRRDDELEHDELIGCAIKFGDQELVDKLREHSDKTDQAHLELVNYLQKKL